MLKKVATLGEGAILRSELSNDQKIFVGVVQNGIEIFDSGSLSLIRFLETPSTPEIISISANKRYIGYITYDRKIYLYDFELDTTIEINLIQEIPESDFSEKDAFYIYVSVKSHKVVPLEL